MRLLNSEADNTRKGPTEQQRRQGKGAWLRVKPLCKYLTADPTSHTPRLIGLSSVQDVALTGKLDHRSLAGHHSNGAAGQAGIAALNDL